MVSPFIFCLLVGVAFGSNAPAWKDNREYIYKIQGRSLAGLEIANEYSGILFKASLRIQTRPDGTLQGMLVNPQYTQIHSELSDGWMTHIPDHELSWKPLEMSRKPFQIEMNHGVITDLIVNKDVPNWEANMIKGIMSQFQMNLNVADSTTTSSDQRLDSAMYQVYEETVSGNTETFYDISPMPEYMLSHPGAQDFPMLKGDEDQIFEVRKHKNYTDSIEMPSYFYGFGKMGADKAASNAMGVFFLRSSTTRAIITGSLKQFTIQHSLTLNEIVVNPTLGDKQSGSVYTSWNTTLQQVKSQDQILDDVANPVRLGGLVYAYGKPYSQSNKVQGRNSNKHQMQYTRPAWERLHPYSAESKFPTTEGNKQPQPQINTAPETPFLPMTIGNKGRSVKMGKEVVRSAIKIAQELGEMLQDPSKSLQENTLGNFITLTSFVRIMDESELRQVSKELYASSEDRSKYAAWVAFRDAIAEAGHGPALLMIQSWIETRNIRDEEASHIISTMASSVLHPTTQYMKTFFELIKKPVVASQWPLNETAILSYSELVRKVYFQKNYFENQFPVNTFENLKDNEGLRFVRETVIPHLSERLEKAVLKAQTNRIHTYIRALGYIGEPEILKAFEPYLEGNKHCSQYQRTLMIISMDRLVKTYPKVARRVLFRLYANSGETSALRIAAVFQLMRTYPSVEMLQHMADYTNIDTDEHVNAAVKTSILSASELHGHEFHDLRENALMARSLLTNKEYGIEHGGNFLKSYVIEQLETNYKQTLQYWNTDHHLIPNSVKYALRSDIHGLKEQIVNVQSLISGVGQLFETLEKQTGKYQEEKQQQQANTAEQEQYPWSSLNIAKMLNMKTDMREQLEGSLFMMDSNSPYKMLSFDNRTIEHLPELFRRWEEKLKTEQKISYLKFVNSEHMELALPNEMGLPFLFTYNAPIFVKAQGKLNAAFKPQLVKDDKIQSPDTVQAEVEFDFTVGTKVQGRITFLTPFDNQQYISGFNKVLQVHVPVYSNIKLDMKSHEILSIEFEPKKIQKKIPLFSYSTWPYTSSKDIMNLDNLHKQGRNRVIKPDSLRKSEFVVGKRETGLAVQVEMEHDRKTISIPDVTVFCKHGFAYGMKSLWSDADIQYGAFSVSYLPEESSTDKITVSLRQQHEFNKQGKEKSLNWQEVINAKTAESRQQILLEAAASGITSVKHSAVDVSVQFKGDSNIEYVASGAYAFSPVDPKSRLYTLFKKDNQNGKPAKITFESVSDMPNVYDMDMKEIFTNSPSAQSEVELKFTSKNGEGKMKADIKFVRSEERKKYLERLPAFEQCARDHRSGNKQSPACVNTTVEANLLDRIDMDIKQENMGADVRDFLNMVYSHLRYFYYPNLQLRNEETSIPANQMKLQARFDHDLKYVNVSLQLHDQESTFRDIKLNEYVRRAFVVHPNIDIFTRVASKSLEMNDFRSACVVDKSQITTFTNWTYPADLSKYWTVVAQYVPKTTKNVEEQLREQFNNYVIMMRKTQNGEGKDLKIGVSAPETSFKVIDVTMTPRQGQQPTVTVNKRTVEISPTESHVIARGFMQIYALNPREIVIEVRNRFAVVYDGERAKIATWYGYMRDSTRGLCGQYNDLWSEDLLTPHNCFTRSQEKFIRSYEIEGQEGQQARQEMETDGSQCFEKNIPLYVDVIKARDLNILDGSDDLSNECTHSQTKYVQQGQEICFTTRVIPTCRNHCQAQGFITKSISVHCIPYSTVAQMWKKQVDNGANPDFSHKPESKKLQMEVPQSCSA